MFIYKISKHKDINTKFLKSREVDTYKKSSKGIKRTSTIWMK